MTLHEIEETLKQLSSRHTGLNEETLVTLLRSGGWEEKNIQEAIFLFRSGVTGQTQQGNTTEQSSVSTDATLPSLQTDPVLMPQIDGKHLLEERNGKTPSHEEAQVVPSEPQSLIENIPETAPSKKEELPHNLPLRPFETSDHIWPFARYKDVFYGDTEPMAEVKEENKLPMEEAKSVQPQAVAPPVKVETEKVEMVQEEKATIVTASTVSEKSTSSVPVANGDGKLVITACIMLLAVLLLLGYMYSNGRL